MTYSQHKVGFNTAIAALIALTATKFGVDIPNVLTWDAYQSLTRCPGAVPETVFRPGSR